MDQHVRLDAGDPTPPFEQVRRQLAELIDLGVLRPGQRLPALRQLAGDLGLAVGTVARAYAELEAGGYLESRRGAGTRVAARTTRPDRSAVLDELASTFIARARSAGFSDAEVADAVRRHLS